MGERDPKQILKLSGKKQFFEVMTNCLNIDRVYINFEEFDETKPPGQRKTSQVQIYLDLIDAYVLSKDIFSGRMAKLAIKSRDTAKAGGYKYSKDIFSRLGGVSAKKLSEKGQDRKDGKSLSRQLKITPGEKLPWVLSAESGPGEEDEKGLIVPRYQRPEQIVRVGLSDDQFKQFAATLELLAQSWMAEKIHRLSNL